MRLFSGAAGLPKINPQNERSPGVRQRLQTHSPLLRLLRLALPPVSNIFKLFLNMAAADGRTDGRDYGKIWGKRQNCILRLGGRAFLTS